MAQEIVSFSLLRDVLQEDACGLNELDVNKSVVEREYPSEVVHQVVLAEQVEEILFVLLREDNELSQVADDFNIKVLVA